MVKVYGADWCGDTQKALSYLQELNVDFAYVDVEKDADAAEWVKNQNVGKVQKPTILIGERVLSVPSQSELDSALKENNLIN